MKIQWERAKGIVKDETIEDMECRIGYELPLDYIDVIKENNGAIPIQDHFDIEDKSWTFATLLEISPGKPFSVEGMYEILKDDLEIEGVVPFATDIADNLYCFDYRKDKKRPTIVFMDHEGEESEYLCRTFTQLLSKLY
ncbi:SMI1/KNR4 family protein [Marininema halotolerans]|uniref:SMI1-KNR4 cell-wall n=1 Tax=Marininema halotolerans TaxID=1155944 RepID=A0A1I6T1J5_9BACL|nr:SMI1/KNR4 family protein [Marininema halotolerans]SFS82948.1 SMI1-KNR4 cell-wall [Marininema halotolerans]